MIAISIIVTLFCAFVAGMHYAMWDHLGERNSLYWSVGLTLLAIYNIITLVGYVKGLS